MRRRQEMRAGPWLSSLTLGAAFLLVTLTASAGEIALDEVLSSVDRHHPKIASELAKVRAADAEAYAADGAFDPKLSVYGAMTTGGYYDLRRVSTELRQPTPLWGAEFWAGYRLGDGKDDKYPTYYADETLDAGEVRAGVSVPLWRDGPMDEKRAKRTRARHKVDAATAKQEATRLELRRKATDAYFGWVAAGRRLEVARELLELARSRQSWVEARVKVGAIPEVDQLEARRAVLQRQRSLISAQRDAQAAAFILALFLRDEQGAPQPPASESRAPDLPLPSAPQQEAADLAREIMACNPLVMALQADLEAARVDLELAEAENAPRLDLKGQVSHDMGRGNETLPGTVFEAGVVFSMPLAMRTTRGQLRAAQERVMAIEQELRLLRDSLEMQLADMQVAFDAAQEQRTLASELVQNTRLLAQAERQRFEAGTSTLFVVNLREQSIAEAEIAEVEAVQKMWKARAGWDVLVTCQQP